MNKLADDSWLDFERHHVWHPYAALQGAMSAWPVRSAEGVRITLEDGRELIDGMASWWSVIHGYNHPVLNDAARQQLDKMSHVMFGGLTHRPAAELAARLVEITPQPLQSVFFCDSGSVSVEVAIKLAIQYWYALGQPGKQKLVTVRRGYHGDTFGAMSVCDPEGGMHHIFSHLLPQHFFVPAPQAQTDAEWDPAEMAFMRDTLERHHQEIAAVILEPIVQGAGGMRVYCPEYLRQVRSLCDQYNILLIADEIATGFGRTGKLFACEHAGIAPDILCLGKALTGGYLSMAATMTTTEISQIISTKPPGAFMHGPTFMANPLASSIACASIDLLLGSPWQERLVAMETAIDTALDPCRAMAGVADVRVKGGIGVIELEESVDMPTITQAFIDRGVWLRPFGKLVYIMPPYIISSQDLKHLLNAMVETVTNSLEK